MTLRAVAIAMLGVVALSAFTPYSDLVLRGTWLGLTAFPIGAFCSLVFLVAVNVPLRRVGRGLSSGELLTAYACMLAAAGVASFGLTGLLIPYVAGPPYFATPENHYGEAVLRYLPAWLLLPDDVAQALYEGLPPGATLSWRVWLGPAVAWSLLVAGMYLLLFAAATLVRRPWVQHERLVYPLGELPVQLASYDDPRSLLPAVLRDRVTWMFFALPALVHFINGMHHHIPAVPDLPIHRIDLGPYLSGRVGEALKPLWLRGLFTVIGLSYLLPSSVGFSLWFFYLFFLAQQALAAWLGYQQPFVQAYPVRRVVALQMIGGIALFGAHLAWRLRFQLGRLLVAAARGRPEADEAMAPRGWLLAALAGAALVGVWAELVGVGWAWLAAIVAPFLLFQVVGARLVAEGGMLYVQHPFRPLNLLLAGLGSATLTPPRIPGLVLVDHLWMLDNRSPLLPMLVQGHKLAESSGVSARSMTAAMAAAVALAVPVSLVSYIHLMLRQGGTQLNPWFTSYYANNLFGAWTSHLVLHGEAARPADFAWVGLGLASMAGLLTAHQRFWWWPLHPLGYLMGASWPMVNFWFPVLVGWLLKQLTLRAGGARLYRKLLPGFLGLILGEYLSAGAWVAIDALLGVRGHEIFTF